MRKGQVLFCFFLIAVSGFAISSALGWTFKAKLFPLSVSIPLLILATVQLLVTVFGKRETSQGTAMDIDFTTDVPAEVARRRVIGVFAWIVSFICLVYLLGFPLTVPLFIFLFFEVPQRGKLVPIDPTHGDHVGRLLSALSAARSHPVSRRRHSDMARHLTHRANPSVANRNNTGNLNSSHEDHEEHEI